MIQTPLGMIEVKKDGKRIDCPIKRIKNDEHCLELNGRFAVKFDYVPDGRVHTISCTIKRYRGAKEDFIETGERLALKSFCKGKAKVSIGAFSDEPDEWGKPLYGTMDYSIEYLKNGIQYCFCTKAKRAAYPFGIAWIDTANDKNEVQTWLGADPSIWWDAIRNEEKQLFRSVKRAIDKWDTYSLFPDAPPDEYNCESREVTRRITKDSTINEIAEVVAAVFAASFGEDEGFTVEHCKGVAGEIKHRIEKNIVI